MKLSVEYIEYNSTFKKSFSRNYLHYKPCIIQRCVTKWKANSWDFDTLAVIKSRGEYAGNLERVNIKDPGSQLWARCKPIQLQKIRQKLGGITLQYQADEWIVPLTHPELIEEIDIPEPLKNPNWLEKIPAAVRPIYPRILIGYEGTGSDLHFDVCNTSNWMALVQGKKRWLIIPPDEGKKVEDFIDKFTPNTEEITSRVDRYYDLELKAGEIIYLPGKWLHQVFNVEDSIAITYNIFNFFQAVSYCIESLIASSLVMGQR